MLINKYFFLGDIIMTDKKPKKQRTEKQLEATRKLVERNRLKAIETKKAKADGTYVKPERKKKPKKEIKYEIEKDEPEPETVSEPESVSDNETEPPQDQEREDAIQKFIDNLVNEK